MGGTGALGGGDVAEVVADEARVGIVVDVDGGRRQLALAARLLTRRLLERPLRSGVMPSMQHRYLSHISCFVTVKLA